MAEYERERRVSDVEYRDGDPTDRGAHREVVREDIVRNPYLRRRLIYDRISVIVQSLVWLLEVLLGLRVILKLISANPNNPFVNLVYSISGVFVQPFQGIVGEPSSNGATLELNVLLAMVIYLLIAYGFLQLIRIFLVASEPID